MAKVDDTASGGTTDAMSSASAGGRKDHSGVRWWPAVLIVLIALAGIGLVRANPVLLRTAIVIRSLIVSGVALVALAVWFWFFSRVSRRIRIRGAAAALVGLGLLVATFRIEGLSGDLMPVWSFRWQRRAGVDVPTVDTSHQASAVAEGLRTTADDWPQFLGPNRDSTLAAGSIRHDWNEHPPEEVWRIDVGAGWSSFAVVGGYVFTQEQRDEQEMTTCYTLATGQQVWAHGDKVRFSEFVSGDGPRATPTVHDGHVYSYGATGILNCLDATTGELVWTRDVVGAHGGQIPTWGKSCSPLVDGEHVIVTAGGPQDHSLVAYDLDSGDVAWTGGTDSSSYSSPARITLAGVPQIVIVGGSDVAGHDPDSGRVLWEHPWHEGHPSVSQPVPIGGDRLFLSAGYGHGCSLWQIERQDDDFTVRELWHNLNMKTKFTNVVLRGGFIYGLDNGVLACIEAESGERRWKGGRYGHGQIILVGDTILVQAESGSVHLVEANPDAHVELASLDALSDKTWNCPVVSGPYLLVRNDRQAVCYRLAE